MKHCPNVKATSTKAYPNQRNCPKPDIRSPYKKIARCYHLARFIDKIRLHLADELPEDYQFAFCHQKGIDGTFLVHFDIDKDVIIEAVKNARDDSEVADWFNSQIPDDDERRQSWEDIAFNLGKPGYPMAAVMKWAKKKIYPDSDDIDTCFKLIEKDEGRL